MDDVWKSSRFWISIVVVILIGTLAVLGKVTGGEAIATMLGLLGGFGVAKSGSLPPPPTSIIALIVAAVLMVGCASFPKRMAQIHEGAKSVSAIAEPAFHARCLALAEQCKKEQDTTCKPWIECDSQRSAVNQVIKAIHVAVAAGLGMDAIGQAKRAEVMLAEAFALMSRLMELTTKYGILGEQR